jgi:hypothetical protein
MSESSLSSGWLQVGPRPQPRRPRRWLVQRRALGDDCGLALCQPLQRLPRVAECVAARRASAVSAPARAGGHSASARAGNLNLSSSSGCTAGPPQGAGRRASAARRRGFAAPQTLPPSLAPKGFTVDAAAPGGDLGIVVRQPLYWWPDDGWPRTGRGAGHCCTPLPVQRVTAVAFKFAHRRGGL